MALSFLLPLKKEDQYSVVKEQLALFKLSSTESSGCRRTSDWEKTYCI